MDSVEGGMNPAYMIIIVPQKEYRPSWGSNQQRPVLKSATLLTELWGSADSENMDIHKRLYKKEQSTDRSIHNQKGMC